MRPFQIFLTEDAVRDPEDLFRHIERHDMPEKADHLTDRIEKAFTGLSEHPERGAYPKELLATSGHEANNP